MRLRKVGKMSNNADTVLAFESTKSGAQVYESGRRASRLMSEFCTVQVLLGRGNLFALWNTGFSAFQCL